LWSIPGRQREVQVQTKQDEGFSTRVIMSLVTDLADRDALDVRINIHIAALAKEHGVAIPQSQSVEWS
jgi:hypothetical protein